MKFEFLKKEKGNVWLERKKTGRDDRPPETDKTHRVKMARITGYK